MAFQRPTFSQLYAQTLSDIQSKSGANALLRRAVLPAVAFALAGLIWLCYDYLDYIAKQSVPYTATGENMYAWGALKGANPKSATRATGSAQFSGASGTIVAGSIVARGDGTTYATTADGTISAGLVMVPIQAIVAGSAGNADAGIGLTLQAPAAGINAGGIASTVIADGADAEAEDD